MWFWYMGVAFRGAVCSSVNCAPVSAVWSLRRGRDGWGLMKAWQGGVIRITMCAGHVVGFLVLAVSLSVQRGFNYLIVGSDRYEKERYQHVSARGMGTLRKGGFCTKGSNSTAKWTGHSGNNSVRQVQAGILPHACGVGWACSGGYIASRVRHGGLLVRQAD